MSDELNSLRREQARIDDELTECMTLYTTLVEPSVVVGAKGAPDSHGIEKLMNQMQQLLAEQMQIDTRVNERVLAKLRDSFDPREDELQKKYDAARVRVERLIRREGQPRPLTVSFEDERKEWEEWSRALDELRAYRARKKESDN